MFSRVNLRTSEKTLDPKHDCLDDENVSRLLQRFNVTICHTRAEIDSQSGGASSQEYVKRGKDLHEDSYQPHMRAKTRCRTRTATANRRRNAKCEMRRDSGVVVNVCSFAIRGCLLANGNMRRDLACGFLGITRSVLPCGQHPCVARDQLPSTRPPASKKNGEWSYFFAVACHGDERRFDRSS